MRILSRIIIISISKLKSSAMWKQLNIPAKIKLPNPSRPENTTLEGNVGVKLHILICKPDKFRNFLPNIQSLSSKISPRKKNYYFRSSRPELT